MIGELIPTGVTFGIGRNSINTQFSGTAEFNNITLGSGANFSGGSGGGVFFSGGTDLYDIFSTGAGSPSTFDYGTTGTTLGWDVQNVSTSAKVILSGNTILSILNAASGMFGTLEIIQDGVGGRSLSFVAGNHRVANGGAGAITLTSTPGAIDIIKFFYDGSAFNWNIEHNYT